jgi:hypoxanthine phosphoribosyltransferase
MAVQYLSLDWPTYHSYTLKLAATILSHDPTVQEIVAISRGGLTFGHLLSDFLRIPIWTINIQSYSDIQTQGEVNIIGHLQTSIEGKHILLVDDVSDTGKTLVRAVEYLKTLKPKKITTMTMLYKPQSVFRPDYFAKQTSKWIVFPYEATEMTMLITKQLEKQGKTKLKIQKLLNTLNYSNQQIAFMRKYHLQKSK